MGALRDFVADMLEIEGAAVEPVEPDGLDVLAPEPLRSAMGWPELARLGFGRRAAAGAMPVGLEGDWLDRFGALLGDRGRWAERKLVPRRGGRPRAIPNACSIAPSICPMPHGAARRRRRPGRAACCWRFATRPSPTRSARGWSGSPSTRAPAPSSMTSWHDCARCWRTDASGGRPSGRARRGGAGLGREQPSKRASGRCSIIMSGRRSEPFLRAMRRRLDRDRGARSRIPRGPAAHRAEQARGAAGSCRRKGRGRSQARDHADRSHRAGICRQARRPSPQLCPARDGRMGARAGIVRAGAAFRGADQAPQGRAGRALDWHAAVRVDGAAAERHGASASERMRLVCDERLHLTDPAGQAPCASCGKAWCRACHPASCPRCGQAVTPPTE